MKRLLLNILLGCIVMGQLHAGEIVIPERALKFIGAAAATALPALAMRAAAIDEYYVHALFRPTKNEFFLPNFLGSMPFNKIPFAEKDFHQYSIGCRLTIATPGDRGTLGNIFHNQEHINRWTAAFFAAMFATGIARLSANYLPDNMRDFVARSCSMPTAVGIAFGAGIPLWFILPHLSHDCCDQGALKRKYYPDAPGQTLSTWEKTRRVLFAL